MNLSLFQPIASDEVVICDAQGDCIEARGNNAKILIGGVLLIVLCVVLSGLSRK